MKKQKMLVVGLIQTLANGSGYGVGFLRIWNTKPNTMTTEEKELWAKVINDARWYDGTPKMLQQLTEHFNKQGITVKNCSIPNVVGRSEQLVCDICEEPLEKVLGKVCENTMCDRHR